MKKLTAIVLAAILLIATLVPVAAEEANTVSPLFELKFESADVVTNSIALDGSNTQVSYDATENAMKVTPVAAGKAPARFRVTYPTGADTLKADQAHIITALVKAPAGFHDKMCFSTRTSGTDDAKRAGALLGETTSKVETWGVKNQGSAVNVIAVGDGYSLLMVDVTKAVTYGKTSDGTVYELVEDKSILSTFVDLLPYSGWKYDDTVHFFVKSVCLFASEAEAFGYYDLKVPETVSTGAYTVGNDFVSFWQTDDETYFAAESSWALKSVEGAMGGKALFCEQQGSSATASGFTFTFVVPADGDYTIWGRVLYSNQNSNSIHYSVDGGTAQIWDFPDEDDAESACYNSWQYFYLTQRKAGTYSDAAKYGSWTISNGEYRHSPNVLHLTAGQHTIKIVGREAGMYIDEMIVTSYSIESYNPNACEGNNVVLDVCKFCGSDVKHYCSDVYAIKEIPAQKYFTTVLHTDAAAWNIPEIDIDDIPTTEPNPEDKIDDDNKNKVPNLGPVEDEDEDETTAPVVESGENMTDAGDSKDKKGGCGSYIGTASFALVVLAVAACGVVKKHED